MTTISDPGLTLDETTLLAFETEIGARLPADHRRFLLAHNGGRPSPDTIDIDGFDGGPTDVHVFFGIGPDVESEDLRWNREVLAHDLDDPSLLPIADDSCGDVFCIVTSGPDLGKIFFFESIESVLHKHFVASSFDEFLAKLYVWEDEE